MSKLFLKRPENRWSTQSVTATVWLLKPCVLRPRIRPITEIPPVVGWIHGCGNCRHGGLSVLDSAWFYCWSQKAIGDSKRLMSMPVSQSNFGYKNRGLGNFLVVRWLRLCASTAGGLGSFPSQRTRIPQAMLSRPKQNKTKTSQSTPKTQGASLQATVCKPLS